MRISDWSSDVCSSDLHATEGFAFNMLRGFRQFAGAPATSPLYRKAMQIVSDGQFEYDAVNDRLPAVSWLCPTNEGSEHPKYSPAAGAEFIASKLDAIAANPDVWAKTAFILCRSEEHTSELQSLMRISYAVFCLKKK